MLSLNLLAFLFHTVLEWSDDQYALLRRVLARRQTFFHDVQALMRSPSKVLLYLVTLCLPQGATIL